MQSLPIRLGRFFSECLVYFTLVETLNLYYYILLYFTIFLIKLFPIKLKYHKNEKKVHKMFDNINALNCHIIEYELNICFLSRNYYKSYKNTLNISQRDKVESYFAHYGRIDVTPFYYCFFTSDHTCNNDDRG